MKIFLICSVREATDEEKAAQLKYVEKLEAEGHEVYWPTRDNEHQNTDRVGLEICKKNAGKMLESNQVHIWYSKTSEGSRFDLGMAFLIFVTTDPDSPVFVLANPEAVKKTPHKSLENVILALSGR